MKRKIIPALSILLFTVLALISTGCSNKEENKVIQVEGDQVHDIPFENGKGRVSIVYQGSAPSIDFIVLAKELKSNEEYGISLWFNEHGVYNFNPKDNVSVRLGTIVGKMFKPSPKGELLVWNNYTDDTVYEAKELRFKIENKDGKEIMRTAPFVFKGK